MRRFVSAFADRVDLGFESHFVERFMRRSEEDADASCQHLVSVCESQGDSASFPSARLGSGTPPVGMLGGKTVIVVGAGASVEAELPTGEDLIPKITENLGNLQSDVREHLRYAPMLPISCEFCPLVRTELCKPKQYNDGCWERWHERCLAAAGTAMVEMGIGSWPSLGGAKGLPASAWSNYGIVLTVAEAEQWQRGFNGAVPGFGRWRASHYQRVERVRAEVGAEDRPGVARSICHLRS